MKKQILRGQGIQGMCLTLNVCDMFAANQVADELKTVMDNHAAIKQYDKCPYDKRSEQFPDGKPARIDITDDGINKIYTLLLKMSYSATSTIFAENDEPEEEDFGPF